MRTLRTLAVIVAAALLAACSGGNAGHPVPASHTLPATKAHTGAAITTTGDPHCGTVLATLPNSAPTTASQAGADLGAIHGGAGALPHTRLWGLLNDVGTDFLALESQMMNPGSSIKWLVHRYGKDMARLRAYCKGG